MATSTDEDHNNRKLASGVTSRSRQRRKQKVLISEHQKENVKVQDDSTTSSIAPTLCKEPCKYQDSSKATTKPSKQRSRTTTTTTTSTSKNTTSSSATRRKGNHDTPSENPKSTPTVSWNFFSCESQQETLRKFRDALERVSIPDVTIWKDDKSMTDNLIAASLSMAQQQHQHNELSSSLFFALYDQSVRTEILSDCRKVVKSCTENKPKDVETTIHSLFVAVHGLRALSVVSTDTARSEALLRVLYHVIITAATAMKILQEQTKTTKVKGKLQKFIELAKDTELAAYEALRHILLHFSIATGKSREKIIFCCSDQGDGDNFPRQCDHLFPIPRLLKVSGANVTEESSSSSMTPSQLYTITIQATLAVARTMSTNTTPISDKESFTKSSGLSALDELSEQQITPLHLLRNVGLSWASFMTAHVKDVDGALTKETISLCQQSHRILWDMASSLTKLQEQGALNVTDLPTVLISELRKDALLMLLGQSYGSINATIRTHNIDSSSSVGKYLRDKYFDNVCTMAAKASHTWAPQQQQPSVLVPRVRSAESALASFHKAMGSVLDQMAASLGKGESFAYVEYCAYRALHCGPFWNELCSSCEHKELPRSKSCCIFKGMPFPYAHHQSLKWKSEKQSNVCNLPYSVALCLVFLSIQLRSNILYNLSKRNCEGDYACMSRIEPIDMSRANEIIECFRVTFLQNTQPQEVELGCFKLLKVVSLHSTIFKISSIAPEELKTGFDCKTLEFSANILANCVGPFTNSLFLGGAALDSKKGLYMGDLIVESFSRSAVLWNNLFVMEGGECHRENADRAMAELCEVLVSINGDAEVAERASLIEKAAKILASIGKRRVGRREKEYALVPLLHSISLIKLLEIDSADVEASSTRRSVDTNLSARWSMVASVLQSMDWKDAASFASAVAVHQDIIDSSKRAKLDFDDDSFVDILAFLGPFTKGIVLPWDEYTLLPFSDNTKPLLRRLVHNFLERVGQSSSFEGEETERSFSPITTDAAISIMFHAVSNASIERDAEFATIYEKHLGRRFTLVDLLKVSFGGKPRRHQELLFSIKLLASVLDMLGKIMQRNVLGGMGSCDAALQAYEGLVNLQTELINSLPFPPGNCKERDVSKSCICATAYLAASSCLLSENPAFEGIALGNQIETKNSERDRCSPLLLRLVQKFANQAWEAISYEAHSGSRSACLLFRVIKSATHAYWKNLSKISAGENNRLLEANCEELLAAIDEEAIRLLSTTKSESPSTNLARSSMRWQLSRLQDRFSLRGEQLLASQVALWLKNISFASDGIEKQWIRSLGNNVLISSGFLEVALNIGFADKELDSGVFAGFSLVDEDAQTLQSWRLLADTEQHVGHLRLKLCFTTDAVDTESMQMRIVEKLNLVDALEPPKSQPDDAIIHVTSSWVRSSLLLAQSEVAEVDGDMQRSLSLVRLCFQTCQKVAESQQLIYRAHIISSNHHPSWSKLVFPTLVVRSLERQIDCLQRTARLYSKLGDHRKCEAYSLSALKVLENNEVSTKLKPKSKFSELITFFRNHPAVTRQEEACRRNAIWYKATATTNDIVSEELLCGKEENLRWSNATSPLMSSDTDTFTYANLDRILDLLTVGNYCHDLPASQSSEKIIEDLFRRASMFYTEMLSTFFFQKLAESLKVTGSHTVAPDRLLVPVFYQLQTGKIRSMLEDPSINSCTEKDVIASCLEISQEKLAPKHCRALAFYYLGLLELRTSRETGALVKLWRGCSNVEDHPRDVKRRTVPKCLKNARSYFSAALSLLGPASELLTRHVLRSLALVTGPENSTDISASSASILVHTSIGSTARQALWNSLPSEMAESFEVLRAFDVGHAKCQEREALVHRFLQNLRQCVQLDWRFVAVTLCPTGDILVTSLETDDNGFQCQTACIFRPDEEGTQNIFQDHRTYDAILKPLDSVILKSQEQLRGIMTSIDANEKFNDASSKREWWNSRKQIDEELEKLLEDVERSNFNSPFVRQVLFGTDSSPFSDDSIESSSSELSTLRVCGNLSSKFDAVSQTPFKSRASISVQSTSCGGARKSQQLSHIADDSSDFFDEQHEPHLERTSHANHQSPQCTLLILDEDLHRFPFEGMLSFRNRAVCRLPSLSFALASLWDVDKSTPSMPVVDPRNASYIVDPEANLGGTQDRLLPFIEDLTSRHCWSWNGVVGEIPSLDFMEESLKQKHSVLLYCGHGGGQNCFSKAKLEELIVDKSSDSLEGCRPCRSSVILMGCSSGRLESVNRKGSQSFAKQPIFYEPEGIALSYLISGAPCVVANLWDVTDHDIDRYCRSLLESFFDLPTDSAGAGVSMAQAVSEARTACKMPYIVGCAPVCYGLPVGSFDPA